MGGGKALVNAYYRSAEALGVQVRYDAPVDAARAATDGRFVAAHVERRAHRGAQPACWPRGGFESNRDWLREAWGRNERGEWPADNFLIRGTRFNQGVLLQVHDRRRRRRRSAIRRRRTWWRSMRARRCTTAASARASTASRSASWSTATAQRFYDEGEDFWPKRYAIWGRLVAQQPGQIGYSIIDAKAIGRFMPPVFPGAQADTLPELARAARARRSTLRAARVRRVQRRVPRPARFDHTVLDDCATEGLAPAKTHWARPIDTPPFYGYALRPGITFTYLGLKVDDTRGRALRRRAEPEPVRGRRDDGRQRARQGLHRRRRHDDRHRVRPHRRHAGGARRGAEGGDACSTLEAADTRSDARRWPAVCRRRRRGRSRRGRCRSAMPAATAKASAPCSRR